MKAVVQAAWLLTVAAGRSKSRGPNPPHAHSVVVILVAESSFLPSVAATLYLFAGLMVLTTGWHVYLALRYTFEHGLSFSLLTAADTLRT